MIRMRTYLFYFLWTIVTIIWSFFILMMIILPFRWRHRLATGWGDTTVWLLRLICGIRWEIQGQENIPSYPVIIAMNHQSPWETIFSPILVRNQVWVLKRELMWIPFFGWVMATLKPIAINRKQRQESIRQIIVQGKNRIQSGYSIVMFPEGHRLPPDAPIIFKQGAARLAITLNIPILPIAHNAGQFWTRNHYMRSGTIQLRIGSPIDVSDKEPSTLTAEMQTWITSQRDQLLATEIVKKK